MLPPVELEGAPRARGRALQLPIACAQKRQAAAAQLRAVFAVGEALADFAVISLTIFVSCCLFRMARANFEYGARPLCLASLLLAFVMVGMLDRSGAYRRGNSLLRVRETEQVLRVCAQALAVTAFSNLLSGSPVPFAFLFLCAGWVSLLLFAEKTLVFLLLRQLHERGLGNERVLIYGAGGTGRRLFSALRGSPSLGLDPIAIVDDDADKTGVRLSEMAYARRLSTPVVRGPVTRTLIGELRADLAIIAIPSIGREKFMNTVDEVLAAGARVTFVPSHLLSSDCWLDYRDVDGILLASLARPSRRPGYELGKRAWDVAVAAVLLVLGLPLLLLLALLIKLDSPGPAFFCQERIGLSGRRFRMYKFRSMHTSAPAYDFSPRQESDARITRVGRFLRRTSLDELPQLVNVLAGDMTLVGPRPEMPFIVEHYTERHRLRLQVRPGITGLWQLSGDRACLIHENIEYDLYYIQHRNFFMDLAILLHTSIFAMRGV